MRSGLWRVGTGLVLALALAGCDSKSSSPTPTAPICRGARSCADTPSGSSAADAGTAATSTAAAGTSATVISVAVRNLSARAGVPYGNCDAYQRGADWRRGGPTREQQR